MSVKAEVHAAIQGRVAIEPAALDEARRSLIEPEVGITSGADDAIDGLQAEVVQLRRRRLKCLDFALVENVASVLAPIRLALDRMKAEADRFDTGFPVGSRADPFA